jgi:hypothetical protein
MTPRARFGMGRRSSWKNADETYLGGFQHFTELASGRLTIDLREEGIELE